MLLTGSHEATEPNSYCLVILYHIKLGSSTQGISYIADEQLQAQSHLRQKKIKSKKEKQKVSHKEKSVREEMGGRKAARLQDFHL